MKNLMVRIHREALDHRIMPVTPEDWRRISFGYFKSTGASEAVKIPIDGKTVKVNTKAAVGVIRGEDIFDKNMDRTFDTFDTRLSTGSRDVPVRPRRTIFPVPFTVLVTQIACVQHLINYSLLNVGTYEPSSTYMAAQISSGEAEAAGSRILDDIDLVYLSGSRKNLVCTLDFGEYDSHCTYLNFREPIIRGLKECFELDGSLFCGRTRVEVVDQA